MRVRRGLVRTWIVFTVLYLVAEVFNNPGPEVNLADWRTVFWILVAPPLALGVLLTALGWIIDGFRAGPSA